MMPLRALICRFLIVRNGRTGRGSLERTLQLVSLTLDVVARALAVLLVERHCFPVGHVDRAWFQVLRCADAETAILEIRTIQFEQSISAMLIAVDGESWICTLQLAMISSAVAGDITRALVLQKAQSRASCVKRFP